MLLMEVPLWRTGLRIQHRFNPWHGNLHVPWVQPKEKKKKVADDNGICQFIITRKVSFYLRWLQNQILAKCEHSVNKRWGQKIGKCNISKTLWYNFFKSFFLLPIHFGRWHFSKRWGWGRVRTINLRSLVTGHFYSLQAYCPSPATYTSFFGMT